MKDKKIVSNSHHGSTKGMSLLTNFVKLLWWNDWQGKSHTIHLDFSKIFDIVFHKNLIEKLRRSGLDERTVRWIEGCLNDRAERVAGKQSQVVGQLDVLHHYGVVEYYIHVITGSDSYSSSSSTIWMMMQIVFSKFSDVTKLEKLLIQQRVLLPVGMK